ncbi:hypothetical protein GCM10022419_093530 [Nonomuraea rosea]|uniref:Uncharacterized protein n=1 Tax=Nonomuraea rosea TaxID=638574 RepID=A0ABP6Z2P9_9ACTN
MSWAPASVPAMASAAACVHVRQIGLDQASSRCEFPVSRTMPGGLPPAPAGKARTDVAAFGVKAAAPTGCGRAVQEVGA